MKKFIMIFAALAALVSCSEKLETEPIESEGYSFKTTEVNEPALRVLFNADTLNVFQAENDYEVMQIVHTIEEGIPYEIYRPDHTIMCADYDLAQLTSYNVVRGFGLDVKYLGVKYEVTTNYPDSNGPYEPYDLCTVGEPLTTIATANNFWNLGDSQDCNFMAKRQYYSTSDLNKDCGVKSYYTRIFFGGVKHDSKNLYWWNNDDFSDSDCIPRAFYDDVITGLRLVKGDGKTPVENITDPETGIVWKLADIYFDGDEYYTADHRKSGADLNRGAKGDYLYLYFTKDVRTGRKIMLTNPLFRKNAEKSTGTNGTMALGMMGTGLLTWSTSKWKVDADELLAEVGAGLRDEFRPYFSGDTKRVDFIRLYDTNMKPYNDDWKYNCPANFNRNARGKVEIFISYSYITEADGYYWEIY